LSLGALALSVTTGPLLLMGGSIMQTFMGAAVLISGAAVTAVSHAVTTPYVLALRRLADGSFQAETALITGAINVTNFTRQEVMPSSRPFCTFSAKGHYFYVHKELFVGDDAQTMLCELLGDQAAEEMYEAQLRKNPGDLDALYNYGRFLWKVRGDLAAAEVAFTKILAEDPTDREALAVLKAVQALKPAPEAPAGPSA
jgi:tetratricopeptide (TPR) repeat protein